MLLKLEKPTTKITAKPKRKEDHSKEIDKRIRDLKKTAKDVKSFSAKADIESAIAELKNDKKKLMRVSEKFVI